MQTDLFLPTKMLVLDAKFTNAQIALFFNNVGWKHPISIIHRTTIIQAIQMLKQYAPHFCLFWAAYPNCGGVQSTLRAYVGAMKNNDPIELLGEILLGIHYQYKDRAMAENTRGFYPEWRLSATWLNDTFWHAKLRHINKPTMLEPDEHLLASIEECVHKIQDGK